MEKLTKKLIRKIEKAQKKLEFGGEKKRSIESCGTTRSLEYKVRVESRCVASHAL